MTAFERLGLSGAITLDRDAAERVRRARKLADLAIGAFVWAVLIAMIVMVAF